MSETPITVTADGWHRAECGCGAWAEYRERIRTVIWVADHAGAHGGAVTTVTPQAGTVRPPSYV